VISKYYANIKQFLLFYPRPLTKCRPADTETLKQRQACSAG